MGGRVSVERVCFLARVRPDRLDEYRERHKTVWPEMRAALTKAGWGNYSIFLADDGLLVGYLETADYLAALDAMAATDVNERWQAEMSEFFVADGPPDEAVVPRVDDPPYPPKTGPMKKQDYIGPAFTRLEEIFHLS
jgi:L-rhamnose mutarotase